MSTDYACQEAAAEAAISISPVLAFLAPARPTVAQRQDEMPIVLRMYLDGGAESHEQVDDQVQETESPAVGAVVLMIFIKGLRAELTGTVGDWYADLTVRIRDSLGIPAPSASGVAPTQGPPNEWQALGDLQAGARDLLTVMANRPRTEGHSELASRVAMVEDLFSGGLRRLSVPGDMSLECAAGLASAAGSLFGLKRPVQPAQRWASSRHG